MHFMCSWFLVVCGWQEASSIRRGAEGVLDAGNCTTSSHSIWSALGTCASQWQAAWQWSEWLIPVFK